MRQPVSIQYRHEQRGHRVDARLHGAGAADDAGAGLLLRRHGAIEERAQHDDDELRRAGPGGGGVGAARLLAGLRAGRRRWSGRWPLPACAASAWRRRARFRTCCSWPSRARSPSSRRRSSRAPSSSACGSAPTWPSSSLWVLLRLRAGGALGVGRRLSRHGRRARLRRRRRRARERGGGGAGGGARRRPAQGLRPPRDAAAQRARSRCSAPGCCGSAGSASTPAARWRPSPTAALAFVNTLLAPAATLATWTLIDLVRGGRVTAVGAATAIVVGLVVVTPGGRLHRPGVGARARRARRGAELLRADLPRPDQARRLARRRRRARHRRRDRRHPHRRVRRGGLERRRRAACSAGNPGQVADPDLQRARRAGLQRRRDVRHPQGARAGRCRCASADASRASAST